MTTHITVKNDGPDELLIRYYNEERQFKPQRTRLQVGESVEITVWNGHLPVIWPIGHGVVDGGDGWMYAIPPATY